MLKSIAEYVLDSMFLTNSLARSFTPSLYSESNWTKKRGKLIQTDQLIDKLRRTKFYDWKYEDEMRLFIELDHKTVESGKYFYDFSADLVLREIILGPRCEMPIDGVRRIVTDLQPEVKVLKSRIAFSQFKVVEHKTITGADPKD